MNDLQPSQSAPKSGDPVGALETDGEELPAQGPAQLPSVPHQRRRRRAKQTGEDRDTPWSRSVPDQNRLRLRSAVKREESTDNIIETDGRKSTDLDIEKIIPAPEVDRQTKGRFPWTPTSWHTDKQKKLMDLTSAIYNIDEGDVLMSEQDKRLSLSHLAGRRFLSNQGGIANTEIVGNAFKMLRGEKVFDAMEMMTALIRWSLRPPDTWTKYVVVLECLECLDYLKECADGGKRYSERDMRMVKPEELSWSHDDRSWCSEELRVSSEALVIKPLSKRRKVRRV